VAYYILRHRVYHINLFQKFSMTAH